MCHQGGGGGRERERERERESIMLYIINFTRICTFFSIDCEKPPHAAASASKYSHISIPGEPKPSVVILLCVLTLLYKMHKVYYG